jgi:hypothetical protein
MKILKMQRLISHIESQPPPLPDQKNTYCNKCNTRCFLFVNKWKFLAFSRHLLSRLLPCLMEYDSQAGSMSNVELYQTDSEQETFDGKHTSKGKAGLRFF